MPSLALADVEKLTVARLREECENRGVAADGRKADLISRLRKALESSSNAIDFTDELGRIVVGDDRKRSREDDASDAAAAQTQPSASASASASGSPVKKRSKSEPALEVDDDFKILVRIDQNAGRVIGKGGETLKYIERRCGVRLEFRRDEGVVAVRPMHAIAGKVLNDQAKRDKTQEAKRIIVEVASTGQIMDRLTENVPRDINAGIRINPHIVPPYVLNGDPEEYLEVEIPCHGKEGRVIGRGAETIREISARSGANCHVVKGSGVCVAKGKRQAIAMAYQMVNDTLQLPVDRFAAPSTSQPQVHAPMMAASSAPLMMAMPPGVVMLPNGMAMVPMSVLGMAQQQNVPMVSEYSTTIEVPCAGKAGRIVGKSGEMIKHLRAVTGCAVDLKDNNTPNAVCVISGPASSVELCRSYVYEVMENGDTRTLGKLGGAPPPTAMGSPAQFMPVSMHAAPQYYAAPPVQNFVPGRWERYLDNSGKPYEHNAATGETRWVETRWI